MKTLIVIDDRNIRKAAFAEAEKLIKKVERLESYFQAFQEQDQRLFSDWYELTFREARKRILNLHEEYERLADFHNSMVAVAKMRGVALPLAFQYLSDERKRYAEGSALDRAKIDRERQEREQYIQCEIDDELSAAFDDDDDDDDDDDEDEDDTFDDGSAFSEDRTELDAEMRAIDAMPEKKLRQACRDHHGAFDLLGTVLSHARSERDFARFLRVWDIVPFKHRQNFAKSFARETGNSLKNYIEEVREALRDNAHAEARSREDGAEREDDGRQQSSDEFVGSSTAQRKSFSSVTNSEASKSLYRKLVRRLHPDLQSGGESFAPWQRDMWLRVQRAYHDCDAKKLEMLHGLVMIRNRDLGELTIGEIVDSRVWLEAEVGRLSDEAKALRKLPSWGFSRRKDFGPVVRKIERSMAAERRHIEAKVQDLKDHHEIIEMLGTAAAAKGPRRRGTTPRTSASSRM